MRLALQKIITDPDCSGYSYPGWYVVEVRSDGMLIEIQDGPYRTRLGAKAELCRLLEIKGRYDAMTRPIA